MRRYAPVDLALPDGTLPPGPPEDDDVDEEDTDV